MKIWQCTHIIGKDTIVTMLQLLPSRQHHTDYKQGGMKCTAVKVRSIGQWLGLLQDKHGRSYQTPAPKLEVLPTRYKGESKVICNVGTCCAVGYTWLGMMRYVWSNCLLLLWCRCDLGSPFLSWVLCHKLGRSTFHLHQRTAEGSDPFFMGWRCTRCQNA
jgi:hypothetical protein